MRRIHSLLCTQACQGTAKLRLSRRHFLLGAASLPAITIAMPANAQLLDPSQMGRSTSSAAGGALVRGVAPSDGSARSWFVTVADALERLFDRVEAGGDEHSRLTSNESDLQNQVYQAEINKESVLDEFRNGMFCSGCNQTRSQILAKGESFPHSGQSIIRATAEQIAAKEQELNVAINRLRSALNEAIQRVKRLVEDLKEVFDQIQAGTGLFSTALYNWKSTIVSHENELSEAFMRQRDAAFAAAAEISNRGEKSSDLQEVRAALSDLDMWEDIIRKLNASMIADWNATQAALTEMHAVARTRYDRLMAEGDRITHALNIGGLKTDFTYAYYFLLKGAGPEVSPGRFGGEGTEGLRFRLGDATPSRRGEILSSVQGFVNQYRSKPFSLGLQFSRAPQFDSDPLRSERRSLEMRERELAGS